MLRPRMRLLAALRPAEIRLRREYEERCQQIRRAKRGRERRQALDEARCEMIRARDELYERAVG